MRVEAAPRYLSSGRVDETSQEDEAVGQEIAELAALADGSLAPERRAALEARVAASPELADRLAEQQRAVALARSAAAEVEAPATLRARIDTQRGARRVRVPRRLVLIGAAATAVVAVAIGLAVLVSAPSGGALPTPPSLRPPGARRQGRGDADQDILGLADRARRHRTSPPRGRALLRGWLRNPAGVLVPVGTFNEGRKVDLWAGVSPKDFTVLTVTREQADGDQASSGEQVLVGAVNTGG